jgi:hypothetical protein
MCTKLWAFFEFFLSGKCVSRHITFFVIKRCINIFLQNSSASVTSCSFMAVTAVEIARLRLLIASTEQRKWRVQR